MPVLKIASICEASKDLRPPLVRVVLEQRMGMRLPLSFAVLVTFVLGLFQASAADPVTSEMPFDFREGLIWLKVSVKESAKPLNMLLDSGANFSVINLPTARKLGLKIGDRVEVDGVDAVTTGYWPQHLSASPHTVKLPGDFLAVDLSELSKGSECVIDGLLGADFFAEHVVRIDFARRKIQVDPATVVSGQQVQIPLRVNEGSVQIPVSVNDSKEQWLRLDTGCNSPLHWVSANIQAAQSTPQIAVALTKLCIPVTLTKVQIGQFNFQGVSTVLHSTEIFAGEAGLLGNGLLSRFSTVTIDLPSKRLLLERAPSR
jgi:hypothetical protein